MLVSAVVLSYEESKSLEVLLKPIIKWIQSKTQLQVDIQTLKAGCYIKTGVPVGGLFESTFYCTVQSELLACRLSHADEAVSGRRWVTEITLGIEKSSSSISVVVKIDDVSAKINTPVQVRPPRIIRDIVSEFGFGSVIPGEKVIDLTEANIEDIYKYIILDHKREAVSIILSAKGDGSYAVDVNMVRNNLIGLADLYIIPADQDTRYMANICEKIRIPYNGAVTVVFPRLLNKRKDLATSYLLVPEDVLRDGRESVEDALLEIITHRTNLRMSWMHISFDKVKDFKRREEIERVIANIKTKDKTAELQEYFELAEAEVKSMAEEIARLKCEKSEQSERADSAEGELHQVKYEYDAYKQSVAVAEIARATNSENPQLATLCISIAKNGMSVRDALAIVEMCYPDRVLVLDTARRSAERHTTFKYPLEACQLLMKLVTEYYQALKSEKSDEEARQAFGRTEYASRESENLSRNGKKARRFYIDGIGYVEMMQHIKIQKGGITDALSFRCHFAWRHDLKKIVIGHCGEHLPL